MSKTHKSNYRREAQGRQRRTKHRGEITVRSVKRNPPDLRKLSRAVISLAMAEMDAEKETAAGIQKDGRSADGQAQASDKATSAEGGHDD